MNDYVIEAINTDNYIYFNKMNEPFTRFGSITPIFENKKWSYEYELLTDSYIFGLPNDDGINCKDYIDSNDRQIFFIKINDEYVGQIRINKMWNNLCHIEDVCIKIEFRGKGLLDILLNETEKWTKNNNLHGCVLEVLSFNLGAFKSYIKNGFEIGGIDNMEYRCAEQDFITENDINIKMYKFF